MTLWRAVTLDDLLALPELRDATYVGPPAGRSRHVDGLIVVEPESALTAELAPHTAVLLAVHEQRQHWGHLVELLVRRAAAVRAVAVVVPGVPGPLPMSLTRVTERLDTAVVLHDASTGAQPLALAASLLIGQPEVLESRLLLAVVDSGRSLPRRPDAVLAALGTSLGADASLVGVTGVRLGFGELATRPPDLGSVDLATSWTADGRDVAAVKVSADGEPLWLVVERSAAGPRWCPLARQALGLVRGELLAWLTTERLDGERSARVRTVVLNDLLHGGPVPREVVAAARDLGWPLAGWHIGLHVRVVGDPAPDRWELERTVSALGENHLPLRGVVERSDGWAMWSTTEDPPGPADIRRTVDLLRAGMEQLRVQARSRRVVIGVGSPQADAEGLRLTLNQSREAAVLAAAGPGPVAVSAVQDLGASQLLVGWYGSGLFREASRQILGPLEDASEEEVLLTLQAYLERACSASQTARVLGVHRNTVMQRLARAERLLGVSLTMADTRLALQLALRARRHGGDAATRL